MASELAINRAYMRCLFVYLLMSVVVLCEGWLKTDNPSLG